MGGDDVDENFDILCKNVRVEVAVVAAANALDDLDDGGGDDGGKHYFYHSCYSHYKSCNC